MRGLSKDGLFFTHAGLSASVAAIDMLQQSSNNLAVLWKQLYYLILWPLLGPETWHWHCYFGNRISVLGAFLRVSISNRARAPGSASATPCLHQHLSRKIRGPLCPSGARLWSPVLIFGSCLPPFSWHLPQTCRPGVELVAISKSHQWNLKCSNLDLLILAGQASRVSFYPCCCCCCCLVAQSCAILCGPMHCSPPGSSVHRISQERMLKWAAAPFSRESYHVVVQSSSLVWLSETPWIAACRASLSFTVSWSLLKLVSIELVMPSNRLFCRSLLLVPSIFPNIRVFSNELTLCIRWPKYWSFSSSISPSSLEVSGWIQSYRNIQTPS